MKKLLFFAAFLAILRPCAAQSGWLSAIDTSQFEIVTDLAELPDSSVLFSGYSCPDPTADPCELAFLGKMSGGGQLVWLQTFGKFGRFQKIGGSPNRIYAIATELEVWGGPLPNSFLLAFKPDGEQVGKTQLGPGAAHSFDLDFDPAGNVFVNYSAGLGMRIAKFDGQLNPVWNVEVPSDSLFCMGLSVRYLSDGTVQWVGVADGSYKIVRLGADGGKLSETVVFPQSGDTFLEVLKANDEGFFLSELRAVGSKTVLRVKKIAKTGAVVWQKDLFSTTSFSFILKFAELTDGNFRLVANEGEGPFALTLSPTGAGLDSSGLGLPVAFHPQIGALRAVRGGCSVVGGALRSLSSPDDQFFLKKWCGSPIVPVGFLPSGPAIGRVAVFPNPMSDGATFLIKGDGISENEGLVLQLFDVHGRLVLAKDFTKNTAVIGREGLAGGLYFFKITKGSDPECSGAVDTGKLLVE